MMTTADATLNGISRLLDVARDRLSEHTCLVEDLGMDSIDRLALALGFEDEFDVVITDEAIFGVRTIAEMTQCMADAFQQRRIRRGIPPTVETINEEPTR